VLAGLAPRVVRPQGRSPAAPTRCPLCACPWDVDYVGGKGLWMIRHVDRCAGPAADGPECPSGAACDERREAHFAEFSHPALVAEVGRPGAAEDEAVLVSDDDDEDGNGGGDDGSGGGRGRGGEAVVGKEDEDDVVVLEKEVRVRGGGRFGGADASLERKRLGGEENACPTAGSGVKRQATMTSFMALCRGGVEPKQREAPVAVASGGVRPRDDGVGAKRDRACPFYKWVKGLSYTVDAFRYGAVPGCAGYFLTHFHSDHYGGLGARWAHGPIYCSEVTARLVRQQLKVGEAMIVALPMNTPVRVRPECGFTVTLLDANHCPGAAMLLFRLDRGGMQHLHVGDFRADPSMLLDPAIRALCPESDEVSASTGALDTLYLDTTYLDDRYVFPRQTEALRQVAEAVAAEEASGVAPLGRTLYISGSYLIGKERILLSIAGALGVNAKIYADDRKRRIFSCLSWADLDVRLAPGSLGVASQVHVVSMGQCIPPKLKDYLDSVNHDAGSPIFDRIVAFRPTGWTFTQGGAGAGGSGNAAEGGSSGLVAKRSYGGAVTLYSVSYSEHSSFSELRDFVSALRPRHVVPTVNLSTDASRKAMRRHLDRWRIGQPSPQPPGSPSIRDYYQAKVV